MRGFAAGLEVGVAGVLVAVLAVLTGSVATPTAAEAAPEPPTITAPAEGDVVDQGAYTVRGNVRSAGGDLWVVFAVDVSGSTSTSGFDCDGSGSIDNQDDLNGDGSPGETVDCEIAGAVALNTHLSGIPGAESHVRVGIVPFGSSAAVADVGGRSGDDDFVSPVDDLDGDRAGTADFVQAAASMDQGGIDLFARRDVGTGTNFDPPLQTALDLLDGKSGQRVVFLLSDGFGSLTESMLDSVAASGVEVRPFAIGAGSDQCASDGPLARIAAAAGTECVYSESPSGLSAVIDDAPSDIASVAVSLDGGTPVDADVDAVGNFSAEVFLSVGPHTVTATVTDQSGASASASRSFSAQSATRVVALGDSYSAGEGIVPYANVPGAGQGCHQSLSGYPTRFGRAGFEIPGLLGNTPRLDYAACSGARIKHVIATPQDARGEWHSVQLESVDASADLVTMTIGGNDIGFGEILRHCATQIACYDDEFARLSSGRVLTADEFATARRALLRAQLEATYAILRAASNDKAAIVVADYPELFDDGILLRGGCKEEVLFGPGERGWINAQSRALSSTIDAAATSAGVWFTSVIEEFRGHRVCDGLVTAQHEWLVGHEFTWTKLRGDASFHPDQDGADAYARTIATLLRDQVAAGVPLTPGGMPRNPGASATAASARRAAARTADRLRERLAETLSLDGAELDEIRAMAFGEADVRSLAALRGDDMCANLAAPGEHVVVSGDGFQPGTAVEVTADASTESDRRSGIFTLAADGVGKVRFSFIVPPDLVDDAAPDLTAAMSISLAGTDADGGQRRESALLYVDDATGDCTAAITAAGDVIDETGVAPSAGDTPGVPPEVVTVEPLPMAPPPPPRPPPPPAPSPSAPPAPRPAPTAPSRADTTRPVLSRLSIAPRRFAVGRGRTPRVAVIRRRGRARRGARMRFHVSEDATVLLRVQRQLRPRGHVKRRALARCRRASSRRTRLRARRRCRRHRPVAVLRRSAGAGPNALRFTGRIGRRTLSPGRYRILALARDAAGNRSKARSVRFVVLRAPSRRSPSQPPGRSRRRFR